MEVIFLLIICIAAIRIIWRMIFQRDKTYRWQPETDSDVIHYSVTINKDTHPHTYLRSKDPKKYDQYFMPKKKD